MVPLLRLMSVEILCLRAIPADLSVASLALAWKVPRYCILARAARLSPCSMPYVNTRHRSPQKRDAPAPRGDAGHLAGLFRRATIDPWLLRRLPPEPALRLPRVCPKCRRFPAPFFIVCASSATTCSALLPINLMPSSALSVTKAEPQLISCRNSLCNISLLSA